MPARPKSTLPATTCESPAAQSRIAAWKTSVPTTRCGESLNSRISPTAISAPLPAEVTPSTKPTETPSATAAILWRRSISIVSRSRACIRFSRARTSVAVPVRSSAQARSAITVSSKSLPEPVLEQRQDVDAEDGRRHRPERHPGGQLEVDGALLPVLVAADRLRDRGVGEVGADRGGRRDAEHQDQHRRHQRAAADAGHADEDPDAQAERDEGEIHRGQPSRTGV